MAYRFLTWLLRVVTRVFFRQVEVVGLENIPLDGPVLFAGNHPNSLIDPILIITTCRRKVHFAAKDSLFKGRLMRALLKGLGAVPLARKVEADGKGAGATAPARDAADMARVNDAAFEAMYRVLADGGTIGIFPEGISHDESQLAKLKTGAARLALGGAARSGPISIVPCGLTFVHPKRFRSRVLVQYGPPIVVEPAPDAATTQEVVKTLTANIEGALRRLTINAPDWDTVRALDTVRRLYQPHDISIEERVELARRFNTHYPAVAGDPRVIELMTRVRAYQQRLDDLGLTDRELARDLGRAEIGARMMRHIVLVAWWLPLSVPGAPLHVPPLVFARLAGSRLTPRKDVIATTKLLIGLALVVLSYATAIVYIWWRYGLGWGVFASILLPLSGWATLRVLDRIQLVQRAAGVLSRRMRFRREVRALRHERERLAADVVRTVGEIRPRDLELMFPPDHPDRR
ncbi:MAG: 1-acyl-sn-glycerol-3-phosphate acyltransferase [Deltaproteobacteria bacterium]|nr:1-acyl-sn-glycerol-3-phosphate acyltransferase [Deltaproteobacteria bacterium]